MSHNTITRLDKDFSGYIEYKDWEGKLLFRRKIKNGKTVHTFVPGQSNLPGQPPAAEQHQQIRNTNPKGFEDIFYFA